MAIDSDPLVTRQDGLLVVRPDQLRWFEWPGEDRFSIFDADTGLTHLIDAFPAAVLRHLSTGPQSLDVLADRLAEECEVEADPQWRSAVAGSAHALATLQLVEFVSKGH